MAAFPGAIPTFAGFTSTHTLAADNHAAQHNLEQAEMVQIATKLGTGASTPISGTVLRGTGAGASAYGPADLTTDVTGVLPQANGGTGRTDATGSGAPVYKESPTIVTPTVADLTNMQHDHSSASEGGQVTIAAIPDNSITPDKLTNRTRTVAMFTRADGIGGALETSNFGPGTVFSGTPTSYVRGYGIIPEDYAGGDITITVVTRSDSINSSESTVNYIGCWSNGESTAGSVWSVASAVGDTQSWTADTIKTVTLPTAITIGLAGDLVAFAWRPSTALTGNIYAEAAYMTYTADS